jgi:hypothetical protein
MIDFQARFEAALSYEAFLNDYGTSEHQRRWADVYERFKLSEVHREVLDTFVREMNVLCMAGTWCGDCAIQCPIFEHFARACSKIRLRFIDRDADEALASELRICGGARVPTVVLLSEDFTECVRYGDRTLSRYRAMANEQLGLAGPGSPASPIDALTQIADEWLREFERVQLMLRLSPRLRERHAD